MLLYIVLAVIAILIVAYFTYGWFLKTTLDLNDARLTPAHEFQDNVDFVPTHPLILLGHHFSSIAGAGPIVGTLLAAQAFGWLPTLLWIILGSIFIGGVHDFTAMVASLRHQGKSIPEICRHYMNPIAYRLFLGFVWLAIVYIIIAFADITADAFIEDRAVGTASGLYIFIAILFGLATRSFGMSLGKATIIAIILVFVSIYIGVLYPASLASFEKQINLTEKQIWYASLLIYCFIASIAPVWLLLQPRDYISSYLLYFSVLGGLLGLAFGGFAIQYPHFIAWDNSQVGMLFPFLFITVACGACSGFHSIIASGTTAKQMFKENDSLKIGYGGMLIEAIVAVIALCTIMIVAKNSDVTKLNALKIYATGMGRFLEVFGIPSKVGATFGYLAIATFVLTTLDTTTRIGRYIFQEFFGLSNRPFNRYLATIVTLALPIAFMFVHIYNEKGVEIPAYRVIWSVFGATNQLLAGLALLSVVVWLKVSGKKYVFALLPAIFMLGTTITALVTLIMKDGSNVLIRVIAIILCLLAILLVILGTFSLFKKNSLEKISSVN